MKTVIALLACALLTGCVTNPAKVEAQNQMAAFEVDLKDLMARRKIGVIGAVAYHTEGYDLASKYAQFPETSNLRAFHAKMIPIARMYESGQITKDQYLDMGRIEGSAAHDASIQQRRNQAAAEEARKDQALRDLQRTLEIMNANRPPPPQLQIQPQINCRSRNVYGTIYTDCN